MIITKVIDLIYRQRKHLPQLLSNRTDTHLSAEEETKSLIEELARLKYELQTNKPLKMVTDNLPEANIWNEYLTKEQSKQPQEEVSWFNVSWLYAECYMYRRMREVFFLSEHYKQFDQFYLIKQEAFFNAKQFASNLASQLLSIQDMAQNKPIVDLFYFYIMVILFI